MIRKLILVSAALAALVATTAGKCDTGEDTHPNAPQQPGPERGGPAVPTLGTPAPKPADPTPHRTVIVRMGEVEAPFLPAEVEIHASPVGFQHSDILTSSNTVTWRFEVPEGITVTVYAQLKPSRTGSKSGWCSIESGTEKDGPRIINGARTATCTLNLYAK